LRKEDEIMDQSKNINEYTYPENKPVDTEINGYSYEQQTIQNEYKSNTSINQNEGRLQENVIVHRKARTPIIIGAILVSVLLLSLSFVVICYPYLYGNSSDEIDKIYLRDDGPRANFQTFSNSQFKPIPAQGCYAVYGYYYGAEKIGEITTFTAGEEIFEGILCKKIQGSGDLYSQSYVTTEYYDVETDTPVYALTEYTGSNSKVDIRWDQEESELVSTTTSAGSSTVTTAYLPAEYWELGDFANNMEVGYSAELSYIMDVDSFSGIDVQLVLNILDQEDVLVGNGVYEDCYIVEIAQQLNLQGSEVDVTMTAWITDDGIVPKVTMDLSGISVSVQLDEYYTTEEVQTNSDIPL
jgi:hypothetical protein